MTQELIIKMKGGREKTLYANRPMSKRDLNKTDAYQIHVGGPWYTYNEAEVVASLTRMGYTLTEQPVTESHDWRDDPATDRQKLYLLDLGVRLESNMTKARASQLIDAAKGGYVGSVGGWYLDGSN